ncbi:MAG TPA: hypothetical protein VEZ90_09675, partial [Blastocatellia bacterium]|nr:hypothetical protein [Blastocatellia bacterium]
QDQNVVAPGRYFTAINVHNPATCKTVTFKWKVAQAGRLGGPMGLISRHQKVALRPDQAIEIDCPDVFRVTDLNAIKGFVVIESPCELDVVAVYTVTPPPTATQPGSIVAFEIERVPARIIDACSEDLALDLSTGVADWTIISAPPSLPGSIPRTADVILTPDKNPAWAVAQPGTQWIGAFPFARTSDISPPPGDYTFQTCFSLCSGFESALLSLSMLNDNGVPAVWLNGTLTPVTAPTHFTGAPSNFTVTQGFLPGINCVSVIVTNDPGGPTGNPMGLDLHATLNAVKGACPDCGCGCTDTKLVRPTPGIVPIFPGEPVSGI